MTAAAKKKAAASITAFAAALLSTLLGKKLGSSETSLISGYATAAVGGVIAAVHAKQVKQTVATTVAAVTPAPKPAPGPITMYDAVTITNIPNNPQAVAGYVTGYINAEPMHKRFPKAKLLRITVTADHDSQCLDVENGAATPAQAAAWVKRQHARGIKRPCIYASLSIMPTIWTLLSQAGIQRDQIRLWVAEWTGHPHIPAGYDACQWQSVTDRYDESLCLANFFD